MTPLPVETFGGECIFAPEALARYCDTLCQECQYVRRCRLNQMFGFMGKYLMTALPRGIWKIIEATIWCFCLKRISFLRPTMLKLFGASLPFRGLISGSVSFYFPWAIIAAGTVVNKDVGNCEIHGGVPNKKIKARFANEDDMLKHLEMLQLPPRKGRFCASKKLIKS